jgi:hypothetical protein
MAWRSSKVRPGASNRDLTIRPLGLGEIIDRAVALTVRHFRTLFPWMLLVQAPAVAVTRLQLSGLGELLASLDDPAAARATVDALARTSAWVLAGALLLQFAATAACATVVAPSLLAGTGPPLPSRARRAVAIPTAALATLAALVFLPAAGALPGLAVLAGTRSTWAWIAGGVLLTAGAALALLYAILRTLLVPAVAAIEGRPHLAALRRSFSLMRSAPGLPLGERPAIRASLVLLATFAIALAVGVVVGVPRGILGRLSGGSPLQPASLPLGAEIPLLLFETAASAALQPFSLVATVVLYFDRRARREGLDLEAFAREVEEEATP